MADPLKIAFIGAKGRGESLFKSLVMNESTGDLVEPVGIYDIKEENMAQWQYWVPHRTTNLEKFVSLDMDAVIVASPADTHVELAARMINAGVDVWCEVPMALDMEGIYEVLDAERSQKGAGHFVYLENYCWMLQPQFCAKHNKMGDFGEIYYCEGEYSHSVEGLLMKENAQYGHSYDPDADYGKGMGDSIPGKPRMRQWIPTWRGKKKFLPIQYPHTFGPLHYVLNAKERDWPIQVQAVGNKIMPPQRLRGQTFNLGIITMKSGVICKIIRGGILKKHRIAYNFWGSGAIFEGASNQLDEHAPDMGDKPELQQRNHWYFVPPKKRRYPQRHQQESKLLTNKDLIRDGINTAEGGHYGADSVMFESIVKRTLNNKPQELDVIAAAEHTAPLILGAKSIKNKKILDIPKF